MGKSLMDKIRIKSSPTTETDVIESKEIKKKVIECTEKDILDTKPKPKRDPSAREFKEANVTENDILNSKEIKEQYKEEQKPSDITESDLSEADIARAGVVKDKNAKLKKSIPDEVPEYESDPKPRKKVKEITDAEQRRLDRKKIIIPADSFVQDFATELGCKVATDVLGSDVAYWYALGCAPLDIILGGGIPSGKVVECFGWESSGKSTFTLEAAKAFCSFWKERKNNNYIVLWLESESALDKVRAQYMGCDLSRFVVDEVDTVEKGFEKIKNALEKATKDKDFHVFISWDTIAAVLTENEKAGGVNTYQGGIGEKARLIRRLLKDVSTLLGQTNSTLFFVNQMYKTFPKPGQSHIPAGDEVPGGGGIKFHSSIRCRMRPDGPPIEDVLPNGNKITRGILVDLFTKKNKLTLPYQTCKIVINGESGLDIVETLSRFLVLNKYIVAKGGWKYIEFKDMEYKYQNADQLKEILEVKTPELQLYMDYLCYKHFATVSPLMKVRLLGKLWEFELKLYKERLTKISEEEFSLATLLGRVLLEEQDRQ